MAHLEQALVHLSAARSELMLAQVEASEDWMGKLTVLAEETSHVIALADRYVKEMEKEGVKA